MSIVNFCLSFLPCLPLKICKICTLRLCAADAKIIL
nr:MAG TPA_asm: hypothetical protein [Caudoviricetes sp.]